VTGGELTKLLERNGWSLDHVTGSHHVMIKGDEKVSVPVHGPRDIKKGTLQSILKKAGLK
jgi:predicted RNA binding protein YcfA (HicA-like mRNA interferase family)